MPAEEPALLREYLILDMGAADPDRFVLLRGAMYVYCVTVARIAVGYYRDVHRVGDVPGVGHHLSLGKQTYVGETVLGRGV